MKRSLGYLAGATALTLGASMLTAAPASAITACYTSGGGGTQADPTIIANADDLNCLQATSTDWGSGDYYLQTADIDMTGQTWTRGIGINSSSKFAGTYDGGGYAVSNLTIDTGPADSGDSLAGFFEYVSGSVTNTHVADLTVYTTGAITSGGLAGYVSGVVTGSSTTGTLTTINAGTSSRAGGLAGYVTSSGYVGDSSSAMRVVHSRDGVGGLVGINAGMITGSHATGDVETRYQWAGGLVGGSSGTITASYATGSVNAGTINVGGLVGQAIDGATIATSYATGAVTAGGSSVGGLVGYVDSTSSVSNSYATGYTVGDRAVGGLVGGLDGGTVSNSWVANGVAYTATPGPEGGLVGGLVGNDYNTGFGAGRVHNSYYNGAITQMNVGQGVYSTPTAMTTMSTYSDAGWSISVNPEFVAGTTTWGICPEVNDGYPYLVAIEGSLACTNAPPPTACFSDQTHTGTSTADAILLSTASDLSCLQSDPSLWGLHYEQTANIDMGGTVWGNGIGTGYVTFTGTYNGGGHSISGLDIVADNSVLSPSTEYLGTHLGLFGWLNGEVGNLIYSGNVSGNSSVGGIAGYVSTGALVTETGFEGVVNGGVETGGVAGVVSGTVAMSYSTGAVIGTSQVGGVIGRLAGSSAFASNVYSRSSVTAQSNLEVGGLVGYVGNDATMNHTYATGAVTGGGVVGSTVGGLVGDIVLGATIPNASSFYNTETTGQSTSAAGTASTTAQMTTYSTYSTTAWSITDGYSATTTWGMCSEVNDGYPFLTWAQATNPCTVPLVASVTPAEGPVAGGTFVTLTGTDLTGITEVTFGGVAGVIDTATLTSTNVDVATPAGAAAGTVAITLAYYPGGTVTLTDTFTYVDVPVPTVVSADPPAGPTDGANAVTLAGTNLDLVTSVTFNGSPGTIVGGGGSGQDLVVYPPAGTAGDAIIDLTYTSASLTGTVTATGIYSYIAAPTVSVVAPAVGPAAGGTTVTIAGTNLATTIDVLFGTTSAAFTVVDDATITATTPAGSVGAARVQVVTAGGFVALNGGFTYEPGAPGVPGNVVATAGDASATITWDASADNGSAITEYRVASTPSGHSCTVSATACTITGLTNGTEYTFEVWAQNAQGWGEPATSNPVTPTGSTPATITAPSAPQNVVATAGDTTATVTWSTPADDGGSAITGYTVSSTPADGIPGCSGVVTSCEVMGLTNGTTYTFTVRAQNAAGQSPGATSNSVTPSGSTPATITAPSAPQNVTATAGDATATVTWDTPASDGGSAITSYTVVSSPAGGIPGCSGVVTSCEMTGLTNDTAYTFTVKAQNVAGQSPGAVSNSVTPSGSSPDPGPSPSPDPGPDPGPSPSPDPVPVVAETPPPPPPMGFGYPKNPLLPCPSMWGWGQSWAGWANGPICTKTMEWDTAANTYPQTYNEVMEEVNAYNTVAARLTQAAEWGEGLTLTPESDVYAAIPAARAGHVALASSDVRWLTWATEVLTSHGVDGDHISYIPGEDTPTTSMDVRDSHAVREGRGSE